MVLSASHQVALAFTVLLFTFVVLPRMFGGGNAAKDAKFEPRYSRRGPSPGPAAVRGHAANMESHQSPENFQQMKKRMEQELNSDKYKPNNNKGYVFTLMPLYAIGVGVFAAYKFLKIKSADDKNQKESFEKGAKKSVEAENQLNELEQRLAQTERMLNSILTQLDPLTHCVKSVAKEQKTEIMSQLQTIRYLMKKRGMDCPPLNIHEASCERNLDDLIESLGASDTSAPAEETCCAKPPGKCSETQDEDDAAAQSEEMTEEEQEEEEHEGGSDTSELMPSLEEGEEEGGVEGGGAEQPVSGLRRRAAKPRDQSL